MSTLSIRLPNSLHNSARDLAKKEHISLNQLITLAVAEKLSALSTEDYLLKRAKKAKRENFLHVLNSAPDVEPEDIDKL